MSTVLVRISLSGENKDSLVPLPYKNQTVLGALLNPLHMSVLFEGSQKADCAHALNTVY